MKAKIYGFRFLIALMAFVFGISAYSMRQYFKSSNHLPKTVSQKIEPIRYITAAPKEVQTAKVEEKIETEFYAGGEYYIIGKTPKGFEDFEYLFINADNYDDKLKKLVQIPPTGYVFSNKEFKFSSININNRKIAFETKSIKDISYKFTGTFFDYEENKNYKSEPVYLEGQLIKMRDGKKIAEKSVKFTVYDGC